MHTLSNSSAANGPIARAAEQVEASTRQRLLKQAPRQRLNRAITIIDAMIAMLERHNVKGTLPPARVLESGISEVIHATAQLGISFSRGRSHTHVMNELFAVQQRLMAMRAGPAWEWAYTDEEDDEGKTTASRGVEDRRAAGPDAG